MSDSGFSIAERAPGLDEDILDAALRAKSVLGHARPPRKS